MDSNPKHRMLIQDQCSGDGTWHNCTQQTDGLLYGDEVGSYQNDRSHVCPLNASATIENAYDWVKATCQIQFIGSSNDLLTTDTIILFDAKQVRDDATCIERQDIFGHESLWFAGVSRGLNMSYLANSSEGRICCEDNNTVSTCTPESTLRVNVKKSGGLLSYNSEHYVGTMEYNGDTQILSLSNDTILGGYKTLVYYTCAYGDMTCGRRRSQNTGTNIEARMINIIASISNLARVTVVSKNQTLISISEGHNERLLGSENYASISDAVADYLKMCVA